MPTLNTSHKFEINPLPQLSMLFASIRGSLLAQASVLLLLQYAAILSRGGEVWFVSAKWIILELQ